MAREASLGMSAPPEVVFSTATDPDRRSAWLPHGIEVVPAGFAGDVPDGDGTVGDEVLQGRLIADNSAVGTLRVAQEASGGCSVGLSVRGDEPASGVLGDLAEILHNLDREVGDNLNAG